MNGPSLKKYKHNPPHLYLDNTYYFITSSTLYKKKLFTTEESRLNLTNIIKDIFLSYNYNLIGWVILFNHYHLLFKSKIGIFIPQILRKIHSKSAVWINKSLNTSGKVWYNYWDKCIRNEKSLYKHLNYIHLNPVKHGIVKQPQKYRFSSYNEYLTTKGEDWILDMFIRYPVVDFMKNDDY
jgi:putative transposase